MKSIRSQKRKRSSKNRVDRLSEMPDEVIVKILSFLPTVDAVRTMLLRRFGNLWTLVPSLSFSYQKCVMALTKNCRGRPSLSNSDDEFAPFSLFVRNVLMVHRRFTIDKFCIHLECECYHEPNTNRDDVKTWLRFALAREVKELELLVYSDSWSIETPLLPALTSLSLVKIYLRGCTIGPQHQIHLPSLKMFKLEQVFVLDEAFEKLISGCPSLQELDMCYPIPLKVLRFTAPNIMKLCLALDERDCFCALDCPNLEILDLKAFCMLPEAVNLSSVREFTISSIYMGSHYGREAVNKDNLKTLLQKLEKAESFNLTERYRGFFYLLGNLELPQNRWKRVVLNISEFSKEHLLGFCQLARSLRQLQELIIYTEGVYSFSCKLPSLDLSPCLLPKLKTATIHCYNNPRDGELQLVEFLLNSAVILDMLRIVLPEDKLKAAEELAFVKRVSGFQRASRNARVIFET